MSDNPPAAASKNIIFPRVSEPSKHGYVAQTVIPVDSAFEPTE